MACNTVDPVVLKTADGQTLLVYKDFKYFGSWIKSSKKTLK